MSIYVNRNTRVVFQGITGKQGQYYAAEMLKYGTKVVAGVSPGKAGTAVNGIPVYNTVKEAKKEHGANASITYIPAPFIKDAIFESIEANLEYIICIAEGVPVQDMMFVYRRLKDSVTILIGPNSPGIIVPNEFVSGFMMAEAFTRGNIGVVSRSGTLTYQIASVLSQQGIGQSTCLGIGGDPITGLSYVDVLRAFSEDEETHAVVLIGEIGGSKEEEAAVFIAKQMKKPVVAFIAGRTAPEGKQMGHAGAIISEGKGTYRSKVEAFRSAGVQVAERISEIPKLVQKTIQ